MAAYLHITLHLLSLFPSRSGWWATGAQKLSKRKGSSGLLGITVLPAASLPQPSQHQHQHSAPLATSPFAQTAETPSWNNDSE